MTEDEPIDNSSEQEGVPPPTAVQPEPEPEAKPEEQVEPEKSEPEEDEESDSMRAVRAAARDARKQLRQAQAEIQRLRSSMPQQQPDEDEIEKKVNERAELLARERAFTDQCNQVYKEGVKEFGSAFDNTVKELSEYAGIIPPVIIEAAYETGQAAKVLHYLAQNPDEYDVVMNLPIQRMGVRISSIANKISATPAKTVSKAPAPIKPISGGSARELDLESMPIDEYMKYMDKHDLQRKGRI